MSAPLLVIWLAVLAVLPTVRAKVEGVLTLDESNFDDLLSVHERVFVQWYAPWCGECTALWPALTEVNKELEQNGYKTKVAQVDATTVKSLAGKYGIPGPVLHYFVGGKLMATYDGEKSAGAIALWLRNRERPHISDVKLDQVEAFMEGLDADSFVLLAHVKRNSPRFKAFVKSLGAIMDVLFESDKIKFGVVMLPANAHAKEGTKLTLRRPGFGDHNSTARCTQCNESVELQFEGTWSAIDIAHWVKVQSFPKLGHRVSPKYDPLVVQELGWDGVVIMCLPGLEAGSRSGVDLVQRFIPQYPKWKFSLCELDNLVHKDREALLGDATEDSPEPFVSVRHGLKRRYVLEGTVEVIDAGLEKFLSQAYAGKLHSRFKSEPKLAVQIEEGVTLLTGRTFDEFVKNPKKDYFVFFTHSRCEHCKDLGPVWKKLAKEVKAKGWSDQGVVIAKMDAEKNECEEDLQNFPRLVLYPAVKADQKMKKKRLYTAGSVASLADLPTSRLLEFLSGNAANLEGVEEEALAAEVAKSNRRKKKHKEL